ncbi:peptide-methionine (S)-S-oxide reductase MsrA [Candidatus Sumerlaeota bacterium]|nr:peptide-methionine (S)-S-oxide reductase MsrA [Candidatus Sumerlaeota bacterium]
MTKETTGDTTAPTTATAQAIFAGGCFWGVEAAFRQAPGVISTEVGYTGGHTEDPTYKEVCSDKTGHAEAVRVVFDPARVAYDQLLDVFWKIHNPTTRNRQGPDVGSQYRSAIFYTSDDQKRAAQESKDRLEASGVFPKPIVTEIVPASPFYPAEEYHQQYLEKRGLSQCHI